MLSDHAEVLRGSFLPYFFWRWYIVLPLGKSFSLPRGGSQTVADGSLVQEPQQARTARRCPPSSGCPFVALELQSASKGLQPSKLLSRRTTNFPVKRPCRGTGLGLKRSTKVVPWLASARSSSTSYVSRTADNHGLLGCGRGSYRPPGSLEEDPHFPLTYSDGSCGTAGRSPMASRRS